MTQHRYERLGVQAIDPQAFGMWFAEYSEPETTDIDGVPVVTVRGPLTHHAGMWCDNYDSITRRVGVALEKPGVGIVLRIDSPGGDVSGCMEAARAIRAMADVAQKRIVVLVDGMACSAGYAFACVGDTVVAPPSAVLGSIGVLAARRDASAALEREGLRVYLVTSGERKGDGDPSTAASADELAATQDVVDTLADLFFAHVAAHRPTLSVDALRNLQAGLLIGANAVAAGLADVVGTLDDALALARGEAQNTAANPPQEGTAMATMEEAVEALRAAAEGDDEKEAARAKRMLAAMEEEQEEPAAETEEETETQPEDEEDKSAKAIAQRALALSQQTASAQALAERPDISPELRASLTGLDAASIRKVLAATPRGQNSKVPPKAAPPTRGEGQGEGTASRLAPAAKAELDVSMGLTATTRGVINDGNKLKLGAAVPVKEARHG